MFMWKDWNFCLEMVERDAFLSSKLKITWERREQIYSLVASECWAGNTDGYSRRYTFKTREALLMIRDVSCWLVCFRNGMPFIMCDQAATQWLHRDIQNNEGLYGTLDWEISRKTSNSTFLRFIIRSVALWLTKKVHSSSCNFKFRSFVQMHIFARKKNPQQCYIMAFGWNLMTKMCNWNMALWRSSKFFRIMYCLRGVNRRTAHLCSVFKHSELLRSAKLIWKPSEWEVLLAPRPQAALQQNRNQKTICTPSKPPGWKLASIRRMQALENCQVGETPLWWPETSIKPQNIGGEKS